MGNFKEIEAVLSSRDEDWQARIAAMDKLYALITTDNADAILASATALLANQANDLRSVWTLLFFFFFFFFFCSHCKLPLLAAAAIVHVTMVAKAWGMLIYTI
jgi:hypothetical protein